MTDLSKLHHFLGLDVDNMKDGILVSQEGYAKRISGILSLKFARGAPAYLMLIWKLSVKKGVFVRILYLVMHLLEASFTWLSQDLILLSRLELFADICILPESHILKRWSESWSMLISTFDLGFLTWDIKFVLHGFVVAADFDGELDYWRCISGYVFSWVSGKCFLI